jgi:exosome complex component RRP45
MMRKEAQAGVSREFAVAALRAGVRVDGRALEASRAVRIELGPAHGQARVTLGRTVAVASAAAVPVTPQQDRPAEGTVAVAVEISPAACESAALEFAVHGMPSATDKAAVRLRAIIERVIRDSRALDTEALCILAGKRVWAVSVDVTIVDAAGNSVDAAHLAAMSALLHARRNDVSISGTDVHVHPFSEREPLPLPIHHVPLTVTYALFGASPEFPSDIASLDPNLQEEIASDGTVTIALNAHGEICGLHKAGGLPIDPQLVARCALVASDRVVELTEAVNQALHQSSTKHHSLTTIRPVLVAPEPSAVFPRIVGASGEVAKSDASSHELFQGGLSSWNAVPADDAPPPAIPSSMLEDRNVVPESGTVRRSSEEAAISHVFRTVAPTTSAQEPSNIAFESDVTMRAKKPKATAGRDAPAKAIDLVSSDDDNGESDGSDDDLMSAYIPKKKESAIRAVKRR